MVKFKAIICSPEGERFKEEGVVATSDWTKALEPIADYYREWLEKVEFTFSVEDEDKVFIINSEKINDDF